MDALESYRAGKLNFSSHTKGVRKRAREAKHLAIKFTNYKEMWLKGGNLMLYKIIKYLAAAISA